MGWFTLPDLAGLCVTTRSVQLGELFPSGTLTLGEVDRGAFLVQMETLMAPRSHPRNPNVPAAVALQTVLCSCPCVHPSWHLHLDMHVGIFHLKPNPFSRKGDVIHVIR